MTRKFADMTLRKKVAYVFKVSFCLISFGFIYPYIFHD